MCKLCNCGKRLLWETSVKNMALMEASLKKEWWWHWRCCRKQHALLGCALWILAKSCESNPLFFPSMKHVGNVFTLCSSHQPNAVLPNNLLKRRFPRADTCLNIHKSTYKCCQKERNRLLTWFSQDVFPDEWKVRTGEHLAALGSTLPRFCCYAILKWNG